MKQVTLDGLKVLACDIARGFTSGEFSRIGLRGPLGAGKTTLVKEILDALGVQDNVGSPTFTLLREYKSKHGRICHIDLYRINLEDNETIDMLVDAIKSNNFTLVEWVDRSDKILGMMDRVYSIEHSSKEETRYISSKEGSKQ